VIDLRCVDMNCDSRIGADGRPKEPAAEKRLKNQQL
jgi:hypothetical protein